MPEDDPKHVLKEVIGPTDQLERVLVEKIEIAEEWLRRARALLELTRNDGSGSPVRPLSRTQRYARSDPYNATVILLREQNRALSETEIVDELLAGNVMTGSKKETPKHKAENIKRSLKANVNNGKLKLLNERFGFPDWTDERFGG
jgi:hypothetical protein